MRDLTFTKAKAIGIVAVVVGHSGCPQVIHDFIYCFHMPLFFMIAGYFFKESNIYNMRHYLLQKIKRLYVPYVTFSLLFIISHNFWYDLGISEGYYSLEDTLKCVVKTITMSKPDALVGPLWFLKSLLVSIFLMCVMFRVTMELRHKLVIRLCVVLCALLIVAYMGEKRLVSYMWNRDLLAFSLVFFGYLINRFKIIARMNKSCMGGGIATPAFCNKFLLSS